jgi:predicted ArsR family transcriptional regulator
VVEIIETMLAENKGDDLHPDSVKVTLRELAKRLRVGSPMTAKARLEAALEYGAVEYDDSVSGGRGTPHYFRLTEAAADIRSRAAPGAFPPPSFVKKYIEEGGVSDRTNEQDPDSSRKTRI